MVDLYCESFHKAPKRITLDIDETFDAVYGVQQLRLFNAHCDKYIVVFDSDGLFITAVLRPASGPAATRSLLRRLLRPIRANWPNTEMLLQADSHCRGLNLDIGGGDELLGRQAPLVRRCSAGGIGDFVCGIPAAQPNRSANCSSEQQFASDCAGTFADTDAKAVKPAIRSA